MPLRELSIRRFNVVAGIILEERGTSWSSMGSCKKITRHKVDERVNDSDVTLATRVYIRCAVCAPRRGKVRLNFAE